MAVDIRCECKARIWRSHIGYKSVAFAIVDEAGVVFSVMHAILAHLD